MTTPGSRLAWSRVARGARVVPVLLLHGFNALFTPNGTAITGVNLSVTADSLWWFGAIATFDAGVVRDWIDLRQGLQWTERAQPTQRTQLDIGAIEVLLTDVDLAATQLFASRDSVIETLLTAEVGPTDTTIHVVSTADFDPASGVFWIGREAITYSGTTGTTFTGCARGQYGSAAARHTYAVTTGGSIDLPSALSAMGEVTGLPASVWLAEIEAGVIVALQLEFVGHVGADATVDESGDGWRLPIDHAIHRLELPLPTQTVQVFGFAHPGNNGARSNVNAALTGFRRTPDCPIPLAMVVYDTTPTTVYKLALTGDAAPPDAGGWHATREAYVDAFNTALNQTLAGGDTANLSLTGDVLTLAVYFGSITTAWRLDVLAPWNPTIFTSFGYIASTYHYTFSLPGPMPTAWVPVEINSSIFLTAGDYAVVPSVVGVVSSSPRLEVWWMLAFGQGSEAKYARITARNSTGGVNVLTCDCVDPVDLAPALLPGAPPYARTPGADRFVLTQPTPGRLCLQVRADHWVDALERIVSELSADAGDLLGECFNWADMRALATAFQGPTFALTRQYVIDEQQTVLDLAQNEAAFSGFALVLKGGRVSIARIADFAASEATDVTIQSADLTVGAPKPQPQRARDGVTNVYKVTLPNGQLVQVVDRGSVGVYGQSKVELSSRAPGGSIPPGTGAAALYSAIFAQGSQALGPWRRPPYHGIVTVTLKDYDLSLGELLRVTLWRLPNDQGGRGVVSQVAQVIARGPKLYVESEGSVQYTFRLNPPLVAGWAPSIFVASGGVAGHDVTADTTTFGSSGAAPAGRDPTYGFAVGDLVRMVQINTTTPVAATQHEVTGVTATKLTLNPAPTIPAASALAAVVIYDDWTTVTTAQKQGGWCWLAPRATVALDAGTPAKRWA